MVKSETCLARKFVARVRGRDEEQSPGLAIFEIAPHGFISLSERLVCKDDYAAIDSFCLIADSLFVLGNKWRDENTTVSGSIEPLLAVLLTFLGAVGSVNDYQFFKGIVKQLQVAIGLHCHISNFQVVYTSEKFGILSADCKTVWILTNVVEDGLKRFSRHEDAVVEVVDEGCGVEVGGRTPILMDEHLHFANNVAQMQLGGSSDEQKDVHMVGHHAVLQHSHCRVDLRQKTDAFLNDRAKRAACHAHAVGQRAAESAEEGNLGAL